MLNIPQFLQSVMRYAGGVEGTPLKLSCGSTATPYAFEAAPSLWVYYVQEKEGAMVQIREYASSASFSLPGQLPGKLSCAFGTPRSEKAVEKLFGDSDVGWIGISNAGEDSIQLSACFTDGNGELVLAFCDMIAGIAKT